MTASIVTLISPEYITITYIAAKIMLFMIPETRLILSKNLCQYNNKTVLPQLFQRLKIMHLCHSDYDKIIILSLNISVLLSIKLFFKLTILSTI